MVFIDLRDRYGITQLVVNEESAKEVWISVETLGRESVIRIEGRVIERTSKNSKMDTGDVEVAIDYLETLSVADTPPFTIEEHSDGGDELRMKYRYLDLRRPPLQRAIILRHKMAQCVREFLNHEGFLEVETPYLIKSTPEGARDFVVPSRINRGEFYALPQSPQTFKQLLMVSGFDKYYQIARCFRDEDLRADRQPEFTQIDCEMSFVGLEEVLNVFERMATHLFESVLGIDLQTPFLRISYAEAMERYGCDKPDLRFGMEINNLSDVAKGRDFVLFDSAEYIGAIVAKGCAEYTRKQIDELIEFVKRPQIGAKGIVWVRCEAGGGCKSSVDKFYSQEDLAGWASKCDAAAGDLMLVIAGDRRNSLNALCELRLEMGERLGMRDRSKFAPLWVIDFPLLEWDEESGRFFAMHHPFTSPKSEDINLFESDPGAVRANAYDFVVNGVEIGGGSIRIHDPELQNRMFSILGFSQEEALKQFGFLMNAFRYGAPPHGGIAFGFDRLCSLFAGVDSIRDCIAFPKNNSGRDVVLDAPCTIAESQLEELALKVTL